MPQVRDEFRTDYDAERGGFGRVISQQFAEQNAVWQQVQLGAGMGTTATGVDQVFFSQQQRFPGQQQQQQQHQPRAAGAAAADGANADEEAAVNPRLKGRGYEQDEEDGLPDDAPRKRQRIAAPAEQQSAAPAEQGSEIVQRQQEPQDVAPEHNEEFESADKQLE